MARLERRARRRRKSRDDRGSGRLITLTDPGDAAAEAYRSLRANLGVVCKRGPARPRSYWTAIVVDNRIEGGAIKCMQRAK